MNTLSALILTGIIGAGLGYLVPEEYLAQVDIDRLVAPSTLTLSSGEAMAQQAERGDSAQRLVERILASGASAPLTDPSSEKVAKIGLRDPAPALPGAALARSR